MRSLKFLFFLAGLLFFFPSPGTASESEAPKIKPGTESASDFKSPFSFVTESEAPTPVPLDPFHTKTGMEHTRKGGRTEELERQFTRLDFPLKKVFGNPKNAASNEHCLVCHKGVEKISDNHDFDCSRCHKGNPWTSKKSQAHAGMVANPSDLATAEKFCGECHAEKIQQVKHSLMSTAAGEINITRYYWGSQVSASPQYGALATKSLKLLPEPDRRNPVDDLLRKKCLRCHINSPSPNRAGDYRATGCAACHMIYGNGGNYRGSDVAILASQAERKSAKKKSDKSGMNADRGYPVMHRFTNAIPSVQCVHCHNGNRTGTEFMGYFEEGANQNSTGPGIDRPKLHGAKQTYIIEDIHKEKGMHCIDCHTQSEVEGTGKIQYTMTHALEVKCQDCHGTPKALPETVTLDEKDPVWKTINGNPNLKGVIKPEDQILVTRLGAKLINTRIKDGKAVLISKVTGEEHPIPALARTGSQPYAHRVANHMNKMECHACHARWTSLDWGLRLERVNYADTETRDAEASSDPSLRAFLKGEVSEPKMMDWLTAKGGTDARGIAGKYLPGLWWDTFDYREWDQVLFGVNADKKISLLKPNFQFFFTDREELKEETGGETRKRVAVLALDRIPESVDKRKALILKPYAPHTVRKQVRPCDDCHGNAMAAGLGTPGITGKGNYSDLARLITPEGNAAQTMHGSGQSRFLNSGEIERLLNLSNPKYKYYEYLNLKSGGWHYLLDRHSAPGASGTLPDDVRKTGSHFDSHRAGFFQTDPLQFAPDYSGLSSEERKRSRRKNDSDPVIAEEKKHIWESSRTNVDEAVEFEK